MKSHLTDLALKIIEDELNFITNYTLIHEDVFISALKLCLNSTYFNFEDSYWFTRISHYSFKFNNISHSLVNLNDLMTIVSCLFLTIKKMKQLEISLIFTQNYNLK